MAWSCSRHSSGGKKQLKHFAHCTEKKTQKTFSLYLKWNTHLTEWDEDEYGDAHQRSDDENTAHYIGPGARRVAINHEGMSLCQVIQHRELVDRKYQVGDSM